MPRTIHNGDLWRLAARLEGRPYVEPPQEITHHPVISEARPGCRRYDAGGQCGKPEVERLVPVYGDLPCEIADDWSIPVCEEHFAEHLAEHLLGRAYVGQVWHANGSVVQNIILTEAEIREGITFITCLECAGWGVFELPDHDFQQCGRCKGRGTEPVSC